MEKIIISINPEHVNRIINGTKKYEYRTKAAKKDVNKLIIYETMPVKKVVAEAEIVEVLALDPNALWEETKDYSGITKKFFDEYFKNRKVAYAYKLGKIKVYDVPKSLNEFGLRTAPQSFAYAK
ncbi:MAG: ASCH domain-containing protein [Erysipelotrichaceae bacterium]|nr:ASCH domain-containing protein [Erysipelotrichaceae bacterium]